MNIYYFYSQINNHKNTHIQNTHIQIYNFITKAQYLHNMSKLNINDLLSSLPKADNSQEIATSKFMQNVIKDKNKKINVLSKKQQEMMRRQSNYQMAKQQMDKWIGIIKVNRQKQSLNFQNKQIQNISVNFFPAQPISQFHQKIQSKLQSMNVQSQKSVLKHQESVLEKVDPQEAKRRLIQARKHRTAVFYQEQKRRRISKIKSKLYHKIKKRQKQRQQTKKVDQMGPAQKNQYIQKLTKQRIKQRITLRHNTKTKHIQNLLRFNRNQKDSIQASINQINEIRHKNLEKLNQDLIQQMSEEYDDENFREQAMKDLQAQIQAIERQENFEVEGDQNQIDAKLKDLKFIQKAKQRRLNKQKQDAYKILTKLAKGKQIKEKDVNSDMQSEQNQNQKSDQQNDSEQQQQNKAQRKQYGKKITQDIQDQNPHNNNKNKATKNKNIENKLKNYLLGGNQEQEKNKNQLLIQGINLQNLQNKYQPQRVPIDLSALIAENKQIYEGQANEAVLENIRQFQQEKLAQIQQQYNKNQANNKNKNLKGWGSWAGPGINEKKVDPQQQLRIKLKMIEQIKRKRKDNSLAHVTITQTRNKNLSDYFVRDLPRKFANPDQFDFMQSQPIGPQWNSLNQFKDNIKPKVIAKVGQVITPARLPRNMMGENKKSKQ